jgi:Asp-tRNA(Asn)/Glu-tRNA(Gln) amidotransferase C subunit
MKRTELDKLVSKVEEINHIDWVFEKTRKIDNCNAKKMLSYILHKKEKITQQSTAEIIYNNRLRHDAVINNLKKHDNFMNTDKHYRDKFIELEDFYYTMKLSSNWLPFKKSIINSIKMQGI